MCISGRAHHRIISAMGIERALPTPYPKTEHRKRKKSTHRTGTVIMQSFRPKGGANGAGVFIIIIINIQHNSCGLYHTHTSCFMPHGSVLKAYSKGPFSWANKRPARSYASAPTKMIYRHSSTHTHRARLGRKKGKKNG